MILEYQNLIESENESFALGQFTSFFTEKSQTHSMEEFLSKIEDFVEENLRPTPTENVVFAGKRQGLELANTKESEIKEVPGIEMVNYNFMRDPEFYSYEDWQNILTENLSDDLELIRGTQNTKGTFGFTSTGHFPSGASFNSFIRPNNFSLNWELYAYSEYQPVIFSISFFND